MFAWVRFIVTATVIISVGSVIFAEEQKARIFTAEEVAKHGASTDCFMIIDNQVCDFTKKLGPHKTKFMDIEGFCGMDITQNFKTKNGKGRNHNPASYKMLEPFFIGKLAPSK